MVLECKVVTCDRCAREVRLERLKDKELDGGFTRVEQYEKLNSDWGHLNGSDLCPQCKQAYDQLVADFLCNPPREIHI